MNTNFWKSMIVIVSLSYGSTMSSQTLNIGNLTNVKTARNVIYVAGQKGFAALNPDLSLIWEKQLPETSVRLIEVSDNNLAVSSFVYDGKQGQLFSAFSSLWDKISFSGDNVSLFDLNGNLKWSTDLKGNSKLSVPAIANNIVAVSSNDSLYVFDVADGVLKMKTYSNQKWLLGQSIKQHSTPNKPLISSDCIYSTAPFRLTKIAMNGKILIEKLNYGLMAPLPILTTEPLLFDGKIFIANCPTGHAGQRDGVARIYCVDEKLEKKWDEFVDVNGQTGISDITHNSKSVIVSTNYDVAAFDSKGKKLWEYDKKIGLNALRGVRYSGFGATIGVKTSTGKFLCADDVAVYLASGTKDKKMFKDNILVIDATKAKLMKNIDIDGTIVDMTLSDNALIVITENNKVLVINK